MSGLFKAARAGLRGAAREARAFRTVKPSDDQVRRFGRAYYGLFREYSRPAQRSPGSTEADVHARVRANMPAGYESYRTRAHQASRHISNARSLRRGARSLLQGTRRAPIVR
jgi:hypothetical protein